MLVLSLSLNAWAILRTAVEVAILVTGRPVLLKAGAALLVMLLVAAGLAAPYHLYTVLDGA